MDSIINLITFNTKNKIDRKNYFISMLIFLIIFILLVQGLSFFLYLNLAHDINFGIWFDIYTLIFAIYVIYSVILTFILTIRRLKDAGQNILYTLLLLIPYAGHLLLIYFLIKPSK